MIAININTCLRARPRHGCPASGRFVEVDVSHDSVLCRGREENDDVLIEAAREGIRTTIGSIRHLIPAPLVSLPRCFPLCFPLFATAAAAASSSRCCPRSCPAPLLAAASRGVKEVVSARPSLTPVAIPSHSQPFRQPCRSILTIPAHLEPSQYRSSVIPGPIFAADGQFHIEHCRVCRRSGVVRLT